MYMVGHTKICNKCKAQIANAGIVRVVVRLDTGAIQEFIPQKDWTVHPVDVTDEKKE